MNTKTATPATDIALVGRALIEASAGTGKTWTLTGIILRLLTEGGRKPRDIIATTFTRKAAAEMQQRVQKRLQALRADLKSIAARYVGVLQTEAVADVNAALAACAAEVVAAEGFDAVNRHIIGKALASGLDGFIDLFACTENLQGQLDELFIGTIDSLCQRWLAEFSLETGNDDRLQINENSPALEETVHDNLRRLRHGEYLAHQDAFARLLASGDYYDSDAYLAAAREVANYPDAEIDDEPTASDYDHAQHQTLLRQLRETAQSTIDDWRAFITSAEFMAATRKDAAWKSRLDLLPQMLQQLRAQRQPDGDSGKLADALQKLKTNKGHEALAARYNTHPFTALLRDLIAQQQAHNKMLEQRARQTTAALLKAVSKQYPQALAARGETTFSEKTRRVNEALAHPQHGDNLARYLIRRYPVMLVDESQDLNDDQATLLKRSYLRDRDRRHSFLLLVGDPKQAIYRFRGGDVANYIALRQYFDANSERHTLNINRRSSANLIAALNEHYLQGDANQYLGGKDIQYQRAEAAAPPPPPSIRNADGSSIAQPMQWFNSGGNQDTETVAISALVAQLTHDNHIAPRDIQILMRSNSSLAALQDSLHKQHIDSERSHDRSVFGGAVAHTFADLLAAIEQPDNRERQNRLLSGLYYGYNQADLDRLAALEDDATHTAFTLADLRQALAEAHDHWQNWGLLAAINPLLAHKKHNIWQTLASYPAPDNLRHLLDLRHIQTILAEHAPKQRPAYFAQWWREQLAAPPDAEWAKAPPLPGQNAVQLLTIHKAKGLESPVTILATGGSCSGGNSNPVKTWRYRSGDTVHISLNKPAGNELEEQENEEQRRLLYVGLTRAKDLLLVARRNTDPSKAPKTPTDQLYITYAQNPGQCAHAGEIASVAAGDKALPQLNAAWVSTQRAPQRSVSAAPPAPPTDWRNRFPGWKRTSFSALLREGIDNTDPDLADYKIAETPALPESVANESANIRYDYPRGTAPGSALHAVLERIHPDNRRDWRRYLEQENRQWQLDLDAAQLAACETWLADIGASVLPQSGISLAASKAGEHRSEYGFTLGSDDRAPLDSRALNDLFAAHGYPLKLHDKSRYYRYIRGEIDHLYQHDGRYYILDYKTNHLGNRPADYSRDNIREAMSDHHYWLQAALYQLALHRLLQNRLPDYDPTRHLGGIEYLYLRGIDPAHPENGKYGWQYDVGFIEELNRILGNDSQR